jgi:ribosomal protein L19E
MSKYITRKKNRCTASQECGRRKKERKKGRRRKEGRKEGKKEGRKEGKKESKTERPINLERTRK